MEWWSITKCSEFSQTALSLAETPIDGLDAWLDGDEAVELIYKLRDGDYYEELDSLTELADRLESSYKTMLKHPISSDNLEGISDAIDVWGYHLCDEIDEAFSAAVHQEFDDVSEIVSEIDSESTLQDHIEILKKMGKRVGLAPQTSIRQLKL